MMVNLFASTLPPGSYRILNNESHCHQKQSDSGLKKTVEFKSKICTETLNVHKHNYVPTCSA